MGLLTGKVALVTGAGGGLGRAYALSLAAEGAKVVVNDLGGARDGEGKSQSMADGVVEEIREAGGEAVANYGSVADVEGAQSMIDDALENFGRLDIVVNNAGILRDKTLLKMDDAMWDAVIAVHLTGTFLVTRAAFKHMSATGEGGRIINTSSYAGLKGNFGQTNYAAAKAGIAGLTRTVALEGRKSGVTVNCIAPMAKTRMTHDIGMIPDEYEPEDIAPLIVWLASDLASDITGRVFGAHGSHYLEYIMEMTKGVDLGQERWTPALISERLEEISRTAADRAAEAGGAQGDPRVEELLGALPTVLKADRVGSWSAKINFVVEGTGKYGLEVKDAKATFQTKAFGAASGTITFDGADTLLGLATGAVNPQQAFLKQKIKTDNMDILMKFASYFDLQAAATPDSGEQASTGGQPAGVLNLDLIGKKYKGEAGFVEPALARAYAEATDDENPWYREETAPEGQLAPLLFAVRPGMEVLSQCLGDPELGVDMMRIVHGEQSMTFHRPLRPWDLVSARAQLVAIEEKSSGHVLRVRQWLMVDGEMTTEVESSLFMRGKSSGGARKASSKEAEEEDTRQIVFEQDQTVAQDQSVRYAEASGDKNPIHLDENVAKAAGLPGIILHGLCTMAFATKAIVEGLCGSDPRRLEQISVRFSKPVFLGDVLTTKVWSIAGENEFGFEVVNQDGVVVLAKATAKIRE